MRPVTVKGASANRPVVPIWIGETSGGRSATTPTLVRSRSRRTSTDRQWLQTVWTALDHWNSTGAPQFGQVAAGCVTSVQLSVERHERPDDHVGRVAEERRVDLVGGIGGLVVVRVVLDAEVQKRHVNRVERALIRLVGPVVWFAALLLRPIVAHLDRHA